VRAVIQRVSEASVRVHQREVASIGNGLLVFLGVAHDDGPEDVSYLAEKIIHLRIFADEQDKMNLSLLDVKGDLLAVSQFTLLADCRKGRRPSFAAACEPRKAARLYQDFVRRLRDRGVQVACGRFQEQMMVSLVNNGPVTILLDSKKTF